MVKKVLRKIKQSYKSHKFIIKNKILCDFQLELQNESNIEIGKNVALGEGCKLLCWENYQYGPKSLNPSIKIGDRVRVTRDLVIQCAGNVSIGNDVLIASNVFMVDYNHGMSPNSTSYGLNPLLISFICIQDGCWIGNNVIILPGVTIGKKSIVGAGSIVTHDVPPFSLVAGNPARLIKHYNEDQGKWQ